SAPAVSFKKSRRFISMVRSPSQDILRLPESTTSRTFAVATRFCYRHRVLRARDAQRGPGKAVENRRDPVTVIGDETRGEPLAARPGRRGEKDDPRARRPVPGAHQPTGLRGRTRSMASSAYVPGGPRSGKSPLAVPA